MSGTSSGSDSSSSIRSSPPGPRHSSGAVDPMRLIFMGTPEFAVPALLEIVGRGHEIAAVYAAAAKPAGRGMAPRPSAVEREAQRFGLPVLTPKTLRTPEAAGGLRGP